MKIYIVTYSDGYDSRGQISYHKTFNKAIERLQEIREGDIVQYEKDLKEFPDFTNEQDKPSDIENIQGSVWYSSNDYYTYSIEEKELQD